MLLAEVVSCEDAALEVLMLSLSVCPQAEAYLLGYNLCLNQTKIKIPTFTLFMDPVFKLYKPSIMCTFVQWLGKDFRHLYICILIAVKNWFEVQTLARW